MPENDPVKVAAIIADAGGRVVGRTRLQKIAYLLTVTGLESELSFTYKHYGPFSEELASSARLGALLGFFDEVEQPTSWGGSYSTYISKAPTAPANQARLALARAAASADAVELELAATAVFLFREGYVNAWDETARRKPEKSVDGRIDRAKTLLRTLANIHTPTPLPALP